MSNQKIIILGDVHIGARNANPIVMEHQLRYFETVLFPYMKQQGINIILQLGDMFDTRKFSNHFILHNWRKRFFDYMKDENIDMITLLGNHDLVFKNTVDVNSPTLFLSHYYNITIINTPTEYHFYDVGFLLMPWIYPGNREKIDSAIKNTSAVYCAGHFEFSGFEVHPGQVQVSIEGEDQKLFEKFDTVFSGHYHTRSRKGNIEYIGTPTELTWIDYDDPKGFTVFDCNTHKTEFIRNTLPLFVKIYYDDKDQSNEYWKTIDTSSVASSYVKVIVTSKTDEYQFSKFIDKIISLNPVDLKILDELEDFCNIELEEEDVKTEDTISLIEKFVAQVETDLDKDKVSTILKNLYIETINTR